MSPVLQELLLQLKQHQIDIAEFKLDLQGLCKMSPGLVLPACEMLEAAITKKDIPSEEGRALINALNPAAQSPERTELIRKPDATVVMNKSTEASITDETHVLEPVTAHRPQDRTLQRSIDPTIEKTQRIEPNIPVAPVNVEKTRRIGEFSVQSGVEKTQRIDYGVVVNPDKTQRIDRADPSAATPRSTRQASSHIGTVERHATDGPLPPMIDMGPMPFGPGTTIKERFLLKEQIGSGGMGVVYSAIDRRKTEARDPNPLVAIKILGADFSRHPKSLIALQREARKAQELAHPNVATVFDFDREGDAVYMTMELLQGRSLDGFAREVRGKGLSREVAWPIIRGVAEGLAYAHQRGLVHSDLKPANIFLNDENIPKLLDFGIARAIPSRVSKQAVKDIFDAGTLGAYTIPYATEEMVAGGEPHPADDIYALGLIAYELLGGAHPYKRQGAHAARTQGMKPAPIKGLPRREWKTIERSISFDRANRPQDAAAFLKSLTGITKLQKGLLVAIPLLIIAAGYFAYSSYLEAGPAIPFAALPVATQQQFQSDMADGDKLWSFYVKDKNIMALQEAVEQYAAAYDLHPRDRDAVKALQKVADAAISATKGNADEQRQFAKSLAARSDYLSKDYPPIHALIQ